MEFKESKFYERLEVFNNSINIKIFLPPPGKEGEEIQKDKPGE